MPDVAVGTDCGRKELGKRRIKGRGAVSSPTRFSTESIQIPIISVTPKDEINFEGSVPVISLSAMDSDVSDTVSVDAQSIRDEEVPGPQSRRRLVIMLIENRSVLADGTQLDEMFGEDVSDGNDAMGGQSDAEVGGQF